MVKFEDLQNDPRFYIDEWNLRKFVAHKSIRKYRVVNIRLGDILRCWDRKIFPLCETKVYKSLESESSAKEVYEEYRALCCKGDDFQHHTLDSFQQLQEQLKSSEYDLKKGAIVIDQFRCIVDGQHRSCIFLKKYGSEYTIPVVQVFYKKVGLRTFAGWLLFSIRRSLANLKRG